MGTEAQRLLIYQANPVVPTVIILIALEVVVHIGLLLPIQFSYELLMFSHKHRLYLHPRHYPLGATHFHTLVCTPSRGRIVVEPSPIRSLAADRPFY